MYVKKIIEERFPGFVQHQMGYLLFLKTLKGSFDIQLKGLSYKSNNSEGLTLLNTTGVWNTHWLVFKKHLAKNESLFSFTRELWNILL